MTGLNMLEINDTGPAKLLKTNKRITRSTSLTYLVPLSWAFNIIRIWIIQVVGTRNLPKN